MIARDIMTSPVVSLSPKQTVGEAVQRLVAEGHHALPVVDEQGLLLGAVGFWQILERALPGYIRSGELRDVRFAPDPGQYHERLIALKPKPVSEFVDRDPPMVEIDESALECAALLLQSSQRLPLVCVVDKSRRLLGVITVSDLLKELL